MKCTAKIHEIYWQSVEEIIEEDRPRILATGSSNSQSINMYHSTVYDGVLNDQDELYAKHYKGWSFLLISFVSIKFYSPFCVPAKLIKLVGLKSPPFLSPTNLVTFAGAQNGE